MLSLRGRFIQFHYEPSFSLSSFMIFLISSRFVRLNAAADHTSNEGVRANLFRPSFSLSSRFVTIYMVKIYYKLLAV
jgi:hypothetical protein